MALFGFFSGSSMKTLQTIENQQKDEVARYRLIVENIVEGKIRPCKYIAGAMLGGSVSRGDARKGPVGLMIDLIIIVENRDDIDLKEIFGPDTEPNIPYHCVPVEDIGLQIELTTTKELEDIRSRSESEIFARLESDIVFDRAGYLQEWKKMSFTIADDQKKNRALKQYFRYQYLTGEYRYEKWSFRNAWIQLALIACEAIECYCNFLYCINGWFIPRKDWLAYFTYELSEKIPNHEHIMEMLFTGEPNEPDIRKKFSQLVEIGKWMSAYCKGENWID
jgi:hypothetical protein